MSAACKAGAKGRSRTGRVASAAKYLNTTSPNIKFRRRVGTSDPPNPRTPKRLDKKLVRQK
eukprot:5626711-Amphidinium_carterae.1